MKEKLFKEIIVWYEKSEKEVIYYRCFQSISNGKFFVKAAHSFHNEYSAKIANEHNGYFVDSLFENGITLFAKKSYDTIEEAIAAFDNEFE